ncbi:MAG: circularly permuted type 2 ATP-grasp protein [Verrucomicrobiae bacterium]|nr:circularly permuted type 2 ATP-grasp protein [Verrucomicrobiae bacterium]
MNSGTTTSASDSPPNPASGSSKAFQRWIRDYQGGEGVYDELLGRDGQVRPEWTRFLTQLSKLRPNDFEERWEHAQKLIQENGVTYNVYGDPEDQERPWQLDPLPWVLSAGEWDMLEDALIQRATLFEKLLADLYGERKLLEGGGLPPDVVYANERFLRPCVGLPVWKSGRCLPFYAADVVRSPDGRWWVVSDRTQAPSGMGYALENRIVLGRMLPEVARECQLVRVAGFFERLWESLAAAAPRPDHHPHIVLYTPGPRNETYFEHAYLARYLGITLAEGEDLTVRDDRVYLKTLDGLRQVDVIWRRVDESFSDPLELHSKSQLGVSGLLQAIRAGNVAVFNPPGSGLVESSALMAFLPGLCQRLLGEPLKIPSVATWWCGQDKPRKTVLSQLDRLVVKHAFHKGAPVLFGRGIEAANRAELATSIEANPGAYVAQEEIPYSTAPVWEDHGFRPSQVALRVFLVAQGDSFVAMPGGLTRVAGDSQKHPGISMQQGSGSKDTWVLSAHEHEPQIPAFRNRYPIVIRRNASQYPSRIADNLFWVGRYAERSEFATRMLRSVINRVTSEAGFGALNEVGPVWDLLVSFGHLLAPASRSEPAAQGFDPLEKALKRAIFDMTQQSSLSELNSRLHRLGQTSRDSLSMDTWRIVRRLGECLKPGAPMRLNDLMPRLDLLVNLHAALSGLSQENSTRTPAWAFLEMGRRLERAHYAAELGSRLLDAPESVRRSSLDAMLEVFDSSITYRQRYFFEPRLLPVLDTFIFDPTNPRSLAFQVECLDRQLASLPLEVRQPYSTPSRAVSAQALANLRTLDLGAKDAEDEKRIADNVRHLLERIVSDLSSIAEDLSHQYFSLLKPEQFAAQAQAEFKVSVS